MVRSDSLDRLDISRHELQALVCVQLQILLAEANLEAVKTLLGPVQPADTAEAIAALPHTLQAIAFRLLSKDSAIQVYAHLDVATQQALMAQFQQAELLHIVDQMSPDDRARLFDELPAQIVQSLMQQLSPDERDATTLLLGYGSGTAGRIMTTEYVALQDDLTVDQALDQIRQLAATSETIYTLYILNEAHRLTGSLSLRDLVMAHPEQQLVNIMARHVVAVHTSTDQEEVARTIQRYDLLAVPVVDRDHLLVGIVTVDDVMDVLEAESTEDIYTLGGVQPGEDNYFQMNLLTVARRRMVWLFVLLITITGTSAVIKNQEAVLEEVVALAMFIPLLIDAGGNVGAQSSTVVIRGLSTQELRPAAALRIMQREAIAGSLLGLILGAVTTVWAYMLQSDLAVATVVGISLLVVSILASVAGAALPFLFQMLGRDPALMSAPFITTAVDVLGVLIYLNLARLLLGI